MDGLPQVFEGARWHVRMADQVVRLPHQLVDIIARHFRKKRVGGGDFAPHIGGGDQVVMAGIIPFALGDGFVTPHSRPLVVFSNY